MKRRTEILWLLVLFLGGLAVGLNIPKVRAQEPAEFMIRQKDADSGYHVYVMLHHKTQTCWLGATVYGGMNWAVAPRDVCR